MADIIALPKYSRFKDTPIIRDREGRVVTAVWNVPEDVRDAADSATAKLRIEKGMVGRLDLLSYKHYGTVNAWWTILYATGLVDAVEDMIPGEILILPPAPQILDFVSRPSSS